MESVEIKCLKEKCEQLEQALLKSEYEKQFAINANNQKIDLLAKMSHECCTPLFAVTGYVDILIEKLEMEHHFEIIPDLKIIAKHADELSNIINDFRGLSKIYSKERTLELASFSLRQSVDVFLAPLTSIIEANANVFKVSFKGQDKIIADKKLLQKMVITMLYHSVKFARNTVVNLNFNHESDQLKIDIICNPVVIGQQTLMMDALYKTFSEDYGSLSLVILEYISQLLGGRVIQHNTSDFSIELSLLIPLPVCA